MNRYAVLSLLLAFLVAILGLIWNKELLVLLALGLGLCYLYFDREKKS